MSAHFILGRHKLTNEPTNITTVNLTDKHNFICLDCGKQLTCVLNVPIKTKHFKHRGIGCNATSETLLHLTVKEILKKHNIIKLPNGVNYEYIEALPEKKWDKYRPDVTLKGNSKTLYIEVIVSHPISWDKELRFSERFADCLVINFSDYNRLFDIEQLQHDILESLEFKSMLPTYNDISVTNSRSDDDLGFMILLGAVGAGIAYVGYNEFIKPLIKKRRRK
ncbi:hypothetical protein J7E50_09795 [Pedobacter sp. ISL-68]|uniref:hypothetical protein n=1 Tax=unclassified Pedobacter TaxID=2628915 RepID=UPI001BEB5164|nr:MULTISPECIES: hypothetical protein [unclassified Pedobacter]MBT2561122.1 hypothetical protein [Pedobacter sp. ISL-64]MBT2590511.1 hypothetical protein [Pedobacter sp. ISL-68]